jgi:uncharacterized protein (TIGR02145 family)/uncharacterized repeat protein (TIGR02543 family)
MTKTILKTIGAAAMAALFCVTCGDSGPDRSLTNDGDVDGLLDRIHGKPTDTTGGGTPPTPPAAKTYTLTVGTVSSNGARGGSVSRNPSKTAYDAGESVIVTATPDSNYKFTEWSGAASGTANPITITMNGDKTLTANFEWQGTTPPPPPVTTYKITISINPATGGSVSLNPDRSDYDENAQVAATATARTDYRFTGWSNAATGTANPITITMNGNKTLTANFEQIPKYTITFNYNNGSTNTTAITDTDGKLTTLPTPTRNGYTFNGWYTAVEGGTAVTVDRVYTANTAIYAQWTANPITPTPTQYTITFNYNYTSVSNTTAITNTDGKLASLPNPTRNGYTFNGWFTAAEGGTAVTVDRVYTANTAIFAQWTANPVTPPSGNTFTDSRDGKTYKKVVIGTQTWMAENLNYNATGSQCYGSITNNCTTYGRLYTWETAKSACPSGWHLPSNSEWATLVTYAGGQGTAGGKLKSKTGWNGTDDYGFSGLPGGLGGGGSSFGLLGSKAVWWSTTEMNASAVYTRGIDDEGNWVFQGEDNKANLLSIRCVEGGGTQPPITTTYTLTVGRNLTTGGNVTVKVGTTGINQSNPAAQSVASGTSVTVTAAPSAGYKFVNWTAATGTTLPAGITATYTSNTFNISGNVNITANFKIEDVTTPVMPASLIWDAESGYYKYSYWYGMVNDGVSSITPTTANFHSNFVDAGGTVTFTGRSGGGSGGDSFVSATVGFNWVDGERMDISDQSGVWVTYSLSGAIPVYIHVATNIGEEGSLTEHNNYRMLVPTGTNVHKLFSFSSFQQQTGWGVTVPIQTVLRNCSSLNFEIGSAGTATLTIKKIEWD